MWSSIYIILRRFIRKYWKEAIVGIALIYLILSNVYLSRSLRTAKDSASRWEKNYEFKADSLRKRLLDSGQVAVLVADYEFKVKDLTSKNAHYSKELTIARAAANDLGIKLKDLKKLYQVVINASGTATGIQNNIVYVVDSNEVSSNDCATIMSISSTFKDDQINAKYTYYVDADSSVLDYTVTPSIRIVTYMYRGCPDKGRGAFWCEKSPLKVFWGKNDAKTEAYCLSKNCNITDALKIEIVK